jgi:hypothetical protein
LKLGVDCISKDWRILAYAADRLVVVAALAAQVFSWRSYSFRNKNNLSPNAPAW